MDKFILLEHADDCTPIAPCASCEIIMFLKGKLSSEDYETFLQRIDSACPSPNNEEGAEAGASTKTRESWALRNIVWIAIGVCVLISLFTVCGLLGKVGIWIMLMSLFLMPAAGWYDLLHNP